MYIPSKEIAEQTIQFYGSPVYLTDQQTIKDKVSLMISAFSNLNTKIFYAIKANYNPHIVKILKENRVYGVDAVSPEEVDFALSLGYKPEEIIFTPSNPSTDEIDFVGKKGVLQNLGSLSELKRYCSLFPQSSVSIRICPKVGAGETDKVTTGQVESKFGISIEELNEAQAMCEKAGVTITGIHSHIGSGFYEPEVFKKSVQAVCNVAQQFDSLEFLDFGGGFGVQYNPNKTPIDLVAFAEVIKPIINEYNTSRSSDVEIRIEPGKFLVSQSTVLLTEVTTLKQKGDTFFVGVNAGFNNLIRPAMYDSYHHIINISRPDAPLVKAQIVGNVCETCDIFNKEIQIASPQEGDILAILTAGGYGSSMGSNYNMRPQIAEVMHMHDSSLKLTKKKQEFKQITENFI